MSMSSPSSIIAIGDIITDYSAFAVRAERFASGGFGLVVFGHDVNTNLIWALKTMRPEVLMRSPVIRNMFIREALTWLGVWPHANIVLADNLFEWSDVPFLALDYATHGSLREYLHLEQHPLSVKDAMYIAQNIAAGLAYLHTPDPGHMRNDPIVHRDLKPENLLVTQYSQERFIQITDFGLAKTQAAMAELNTIELEEAEASETVTIQPTRSQRYRTQRGAAMGTPAYMAPEQWEDAALAGPPADVYAMGIIIGELFLGKHPLLSLTGQHTQEDWRHAHLHSPRHPLPANLPKSIHTLYTRMLSVDPAQRPTSDEAIAKLQMSAQQLNLNAYSPPEIYTPTIENQYAYWLSWGNAYYQFNIYDEALARINQAIAIDPDHPFGYETRGNIFRQTGQVETALTDYDHALAAYQAHMPNDKRQRVAWSMRGASLRALERYAEAEKSYANACNIDAQGANTWYNRAGNHYSWAKAEKQAGRLASAREHMDLAITYIQRAIIINPKDPDYQKNLAAYQQVRKDLDQI